jgi:preprotein translocase subunit SecA
VSAWWRSPFGGRKPASEPSIDIVQRLRAQYARLEDDELRGVARNATALVELLAVTAVVAARVMQLDMFEVQLRGALALGDGAIVEMQTGEGKTLAAVGTVVWHARSGQGVHVLTANDYLAGRDADWMRGIYEWFGLSVGVIRQGLEPGERRAAYRCDVTYATANEVGFDYLRDQLALYPQDQVLRPFATAIVDEADSLLIDEARIPLVISGGVAEPSELAARANAAVRDLTPGTHFTVERQGRDVSLTDAGIASVEGALGVDLFDGENLSLMTAVQDALHAHALLRKDVDYLVQDGAVLSVDEFKGRVVHDRRWPAGLQTALELKEDVTPRRQGRILGSITIQNLIALYPAICGMTGTASTQDEELREVYDLEVAVLPTHRPIVRVDQPDAIFATRAEKEAALLEEIRRAHASGQPVLVGTASVEESERLSQALGELPHHVLNARNEEAEAKVVARAGEVGAITISTNMAGRGVDIRLGPGVVERGGLYVMGTNRHESRRIDNQLRGRAGRQGDPGRSRFFVSREDPLLQRYSEEESGRGATPDSIQRIAEGQSLDIRLFLRKYERVLEGQRLAIHSRRQAVLVGTTPCASERERLVTLTLLDELWADYLAATDDVRAGSVWVALSGNDPHQEYLTRVHAMFQELERTLVAELPARLAEAERSGVDVTQRGATWTYLTTDQPFGTLTERVMRGLARIVRRGLRPRRR